MDSILAEYIVRVETISAPIDNGGIGIFLCRVLNQPVVCQFVIAGNLQIHKDDRFHILKNLHYLVDLLRTHGTVVA